MHRSEKSFPPSKKFPALLFPTHPPDFSETAPARVETPPSPGKATSAQQPPPAPPASAAAQTVSARGPHADRSKPHPHLFPPPHTGDQSPQQTANLQEFPSCPRPPILTSAPPHPPSLSSPKARATAGSKSSALPIKRESYHPISRASAKAPPLHLAIPPPPPR